MTHIQLITLIMNMWIIGTFITPNKEARLPMCAMAFAFLVFLIVSVVHP